MLNIFSNENVDKPKLTFVSPQRIVPNRNQPRQVFDEVKLYELAESIKEHGILQPLSVRKIDTERYELIAGERRLRASMLIGLKSVPVIINKYSDNDSLVLAIIENIQRHDLNYFEEAESYRKLMCECKLTQEELAKRLGKNQSTIANKLRLLKLNSDVRQLLLEYNLTERHARALLKIDDKELQEKALQEISMKNLNVQQTEFLIMSLKGEVQKKDKKKIKDKRYIRLFKDLRIFSSTINQTVDMIKKAGIPVKSDKSETESYIEYVIRIDKNAIGQPKMQASV